MKKLIVIPIMFIYLLAVSGVMINMHYCGNELESWGVYSSEDAGCAEDDCADDAEHTTNSDCCKNEVITAKITIDHDVSDVFKLKLSVVEWIAPQPIVFHAADNSFAAASHKRTTGRPNAPPGLWQNIPLFKLHSSFTYYG